MVFTARLMCFIFWQNVLYIVSASVEAYMAVGQVSPARLFHILRSGQLSGIYKIDKGVGVECDGGHSMYFIKELYCSSLYRVVVITWGNVPQITFIS